MANFSFILRDPYRENSLSEVKKRIKNNQDIRPLLSTGETTVYMIISFDAKHRFKAKTDIKAFPLQWDFEKQRMKSGAAGAMDTNKRLNDLEKDVREKYNTLRTTDPGVSFDQVKEYLQAFIAKTQLPRFTDTELSFFGVYDKYLTIKGKDLHPRTIQKFNTTKKILEKFTGLYYPKYFGFDSIDLIFFDQFRQYLQYEIENPKSKGKGFRDDTTAKVIENFKNFLKWANDRKFHKNRIYEDKGFNIKRDKNLDLVALTIHELKQFYQHDFGKDKHLDRIRDLFCFAAFTGQRWSDIEAFTAADVFGDTWTFRAYKTGKDTVIPFVGYFAPALDILKKYGLKLPILTNQKFNEYVKIAAREAKLNRTVKLTRYQGSREIIYEKPIHEVISSHMGRRSAVSILLNVYNMPVSQVMEITGHTDYKTLKRYIDKNPAALRENLSKTQSVTAYGKMKLVKSKSA
jgi:integrase